MKNSKNDDLNGKTKNKKHSNNISVENSNKDLADKKEDNLKYPLFGGTMLCMIELFLLKLVSLINEVRLINPLKPF